ncbi:uncharacterized protein JCM15063_006383 [Sporobolomyces koalae]|uniref:uncharacterized protein n=1 Tax=Sporobolomyces koalae TaxID=500713 RepID=UPI00316B0792
MSANFYLSSHANHHLHPRAAVVAARHEDYKHATEQELAFIEIWSASGTQSRSMLICPHPGPLELTSLPFVPGSRPSQAMQKMCKRLNLRQQVLSTAIVYFRRFYLRNSLCETEPTLVAAACVYVAAKAEETPVHVKSAVSEARAVFHEMGITASAFTWDNNRLAEMEFYLIEELDFHLIVYHPYRALLQLCGRDRGVQAGGQEQRRRMLEMDDPTFQMAWFIINDTFRSSLCLIHPPHLIALAAIYLALSMHPPRSLTAAFQSLPVSSESNSLESESLSSQSVPSQPANAVPSAAGIATRTRRRGSADSTANVSPASPSSSSTTSTSTTTTTKPGIGGQTDPLTFLASLEIDQTILLEIIQEIIALYELWSILESPNNLVGSSTPTSATPGTTNPTAAGGTTSGGGRGSKLEGNSVDQKIVGLLKRIQDSRMKELREEKSRHAQVPVQR